MRIQAFSTGKGYVKEAMWRARRSGLARHLDTFTDRRWSEAIPIYVWVIEHEEGIFVVDTGERADAPHAPFARFEITPEQEVGPQLAALGITPADVRAVILTHLHGDHMDGMATFADNTFLVGRDEWQDTQKLSQRLIFRALGQQIPSWFQPQLVDLRPEPLGPFPRSFAVTRDGAITLVPTPGHTRGHLSVVVRDGDLSYFLAGDSAYTERHLLERQLDGVGFYPQAARRSMDQIAAYMAQHPTVFLPSHDPDAGRRLRELAITTPTAVGGAYGAGKIAA